MDRRGNMEVWRQEDTSTFNQPITIMIKCSSSERESIRKRTKEEDEKKAQM